jgi:hypothetical protein
MRLHKEAYEIKKRKEGNNCLVVQNKLTAQAKQK